MDYPISGGGGGGGGGGGASGSDRNLQLPLTPSNNREQMQRRRSVEIDPAFMESIQKLQDSTTNRIFKFQTWIHAMNEQTDVPSYIRELQTVPAKELASAFSLPEVHMGTSILEVLRAFKNDKNVMVRAFNNKDNGGDLTRTNSFARTKSAKTEDGERDWENSQSVILSRSAFFEAAMRSESLLSPVSSIAFDIPPTGLVSCNDTLDIVLEEMIVSGFEEVGVVSDEDTVIGVLLFDDIFSLIMRTIDDRAHDKTNTPFTHAERDGGEMEDELVAFNKDEAKRMEKKEIEQAKMTPAQKIALDWGSNMWTEFLIIACALLDISCAIYEFSRGDDGEDDNRIVVLTGCILYVYVFETAVRIFAFRLRILTLPLEIVDLFIISVSIAIYITVLADPNQKDIKAFVTFMRALRFLRLVKVGKRLRKIVSSSKTRYQKNGFDLDLTYVTPTVIAMSLPAVGAEANYRNPIEEVQRFFMTMHKDTYLIFNLCAERQYPTAGFDGRVERIECQDHNPPKMNQIISFVERASSFLEEDKQRVIAVHCKGGKGRTGVMVSAWLLYSTFAATSDDAMDWFAECRTGKRAKAIQGVTMASQRRYVAYLEEVFNVGGYRVNSVVLRKIVMHTCPAMDKDGGCDPWFKIEEDGRVVYDMLQEYNAQNKQIENMSKNETKREFNNLNLLLTGDIRLTFYDMDYAPPRQQVMFFFWLHTGFIRESPLTIEKKFCDMASADKKCKVFNDSFKVEIFFDYPGQNEGETGAAQAALPDDGPRPELGQWRKVSKPSARTIEIARKNRGIAQEIKEGAVIDLSTEEARKAGISHTETSRNLGRRTSFHMNELLSLKIPEDNLCMAKGPLVKHENVHMFSATANGRARRNSGESIHKHRLANKISKGQSKKLFGRVSGVARHLVSGNKKRFEEDGFDLDLTYITPRIIAMGFPSQGVEGQYRNSEVDVYRFFQERHAAHYRIVNLCSERDYSLDTFHQACVRYPFPDHNPCAMELLVPCCSHIHTFLQADKNNVVAIHCKAGKGRTGLITVAYLIYCGLKKTAQDARDFYDTQRTHDGKGLTIISQIRYVHYFEQYLLRAKEKRPVKVIQSQSTAVIIQKIILNTVPHIDRDGGSDPFFTIAIKSEHDGENYKIFSSRDHYKPVHHKKDAKNIGFSVLSSDGKQGLRAAGDMEICFQDYDILSKPTRMFSCWLHSEFMLDPPTAMGGKVVTLSDERCGREGIPKGSMALTLMKFELDQAAKDTKNLKFDANFAMEVIFTKSADKGTGPALDESIKASKSKATKKAPALYFERDLYEKQKSKSASQGLTNHMPFDEWLGKFHAHIDNTWTSEGESSFRGGSNGVEGLAAEAGNESPIHRTSKAIVAVASSVAVPSADEMADASFKNWRHSSSYRGSFNRSTTGSMGADGNNSPLRSLDVAALGRPPSAIGAVGKASSQKRTLEAAVPDSISTDATLGFPQTPSAHGGETQSTPESPIRMPELPESFRRPVPPPRVKGGVGEQGILSLASPPGTVSLESVLPSFPIDSSPTSSPQ